jgi:hypothetical protein
MKRIALLAMVAGLGTTAAAQGLDRNAAREACGADYSKYCSAVMPGGGRILRCLGQHLEKLAPACRSMVTQAAAAKTQAN